jgi:3-oxoacyl-[acyl-carrier protein] reductase
MKLQDKTALVTGGSSGIGEAIAIRFAAEGAAVAVLARADVGRAQAVVGKIAADGGTATPYAADVTDAGAVDDLVEKVIAELGRIDILVNSAGVFYPTPIGETDESAFDRMVDLNLKGTFLMINAVAPGMRARRYGKIINLSSICGFMGFKGYALYCATKGAIVMLTKTLALELAGDNVNVNAIAPGNTASPMNADIRTKPELRAFYDEIAARTPSGQAYSAPEDMAETALFLASDASRAMHGATLLMDEGFSAGM